MTVLPLALKTEDVEAASLNPLFSRLALGCRTGSPMLNVIKSGKVRNVPTAAFVSLFLLYLLLSVVNCDGDFCDASISGTMATDWISSVTGMQLRLLAGSL